MDDGSPALEVGFAIDTGGSFDQLVQLQNAMDTAEAKIVADAARIERATTGMLDLGGATASISSFGNAVTKEAQAAARELARVEKAGEALSRQLERQTSTFGKSREEIRGMKVEAAALAAEQQGLTELAQRLRAQEAALYDQEFAAARRAAQEAQAMAEEKAIAAQRAEAAAAQEAASIRLAADAAAKAAREHAQLAAMVRGSHAAQMADAEAAERLRMSTDPLYAATKRLNEEIAESTRLYYAGVTGQAEYARQQEVLTGRLRQLDSALDGTGRVAAKSGYIMTQFSFQLNDVATMAAMGAPPMQIFASQAGQIFQLAQMAEGGVKGFAAQLGSLALAFAPFIAVAGVAVGAFALFSRSVSSGIDTKAMVDGLGLTREEIKKLKDTSVDTGDVITATFQVIAERVGISLKGMNKFFGEAMDWMTTAGRNYLAALYSSYVGTFRAIGEVVKGVFSGKGVDEILSDVGDAYKGAFDEANESMKRFGDDVRKQIADNKLADLKKQADEIRKDRTPKNDRAAERAAREAAAVEAQIRGLYKLADAYRVSGAEALIAEARVKAETDAIKKRIDLDAAVDRQIRLAMAQRVSDAAKDIAATRDQAAAQEAVNGMVAAGLVPAARANELVQERIADLPLLAAIEAAQQRGLKTEAEKATAALADQRVERERARKAATDAQFNSDMAAANDQLEMLRAELSLIGATNSERAIELATLKAIQEARARTYDPEQAAAYVAAQREIAVQTERNAQAQRNYNDALSYAADRWDLIARNVENAAQGMADAFGSVGQAIGDMAAIYANFEANRTRLDRQRLDAIKAAGADEAAINRANAKFAIAQATSQIGLYGDMTVAAKGFFKTGSDGYKALETAEKAFRAVEFALSVRAIAQDAVETASSIAKSGARTASKAVEAVVTAISSLPFPANLAAGAATIAALASIGVSLAGSFGGGKNNLPKANEGTGTVLGDADAKSESIRRGIDALKEVDTLMLSTSREMAASLKSIESQIGDFARLIVRNGNVNASGGIDTGFSQDTTGKLLEGIITGGGLVSKIPIIGGIIGGIGSVIGSLFGTKTSVVGSGLYGGAQSLEDILAGGFDASYYSDIKKKKKFLGVTTSTKYSTQYANADPELENQFTLILRQFNDAIAAAAGPLGAATEDVQQRLNDFVVNIGKIDLQGLTGDEIEEKLTAVFGAAADKMANAAFPGIERFQQVGEGAFETLVRVASVVEAVNASFDQLGIAATGMSIDVKMAVADQFESVSAMTSAVQSYFEAFYTPAEQAAAKTAQFAKVFDSLGLAMPDTLDDFRALVEAQNLTTDAGRATYATLIQLAPAFADLKTSMEGAKTAADILAERQDLERKLLELQGDTAALRALDLAKLDPSNRALQEQIYAIQDAQEAAQAAEQLRQAWQSVGDSIMDEVERIRGLTGGSDGGSFASLMGQFNAATAAARGGDQDMAKALPGLSQALIRAATEQATSRQELDRVQAQIAASLEATNSVIQQIAGTGTASTTDTLAAAATAAQASGATPSAANDDMLAELKALRAEVAQLREENNSGHAATAGNTGAIKRKFEDVTADSGGNAVSTVAAA